MPNPIRRLSTVLRLSKQPGLASPTSPTAQPGNVAAETIAESPTATAIEPVAAGEAARSDTQAAPAVVAAKDAPTSATTTAAIAAATTAASPHSALPSSPSIGATAIVPSVAQFLRSAKENYLRDIKESPLKGSEWTVVMGNEAGDLDSLASSIAFAYLYQQQHNTPTIPLIQTARADLRLRAENLWALQFASLTSSTCEELLTIDDIPPVSSSSPFPSHKFALVDHNSLGASFTQDNPKATVVAVADHHADEDHHHTADPRVIAPAGSCASHVALLFAEVESDSSSSPSGSTPPLPHELGNLLLQSILIDTNGLKLGGKALATDVLAVRYLLPRTSFFAAPPSPANPYVVPDPLKEELQALAPASIMTASLSPVSISESGKEQGDLFDAPAIRELNRVLGEKKDDVSHLSGWDLLRRDYKETEHPLHWLAGAGAGAGADGAAVPTIKAGLSTVPVPLTTAVWADKPEKTLVEDAARWMEARGLTVLGVLTSFKEREGGKKARKNSFAGLFSFGGVKKDKKDKKSDGDGEDEAAGSAEAKDGKKKKEKGKKKAAAEEDKKDKKKAEDEEDGENKKDKKKDKKKKDKDEDEDGENKKDKDKKKDKDDKPKPKKVHRREMAWFVRASDAISPAQLDLIAQRLWEGLEAHDELKVIAHPDKKLARLAKKVTEVRLEVDVPATPEKADDEATSVSPPTSPNPADPTSPSSPAPASDTEQVAAETSKSSAKEKEKAAKKAQKEKEKREKEAKKEKPKDDKKKAGKEKDDKKKHNTVLKRIQIRIHIYEQGNAAATRKTTAPILKAILEAKPQTPPPAATAPASTLEEVPAPAAESGVAKTEVAAPVVVPLAENGNNNGTANGNGAEAAKVIAVEATNGTNGAAAKV